MAQKDWEVYRLKKEAHLDKYKTKATIHSFTDPGKVYTLKMTHDGHITCNCPSWVFNQSGDRQCKHTRAVTENTDNLVTMFFYSDLYSVEIEHNGTKWAIQKVGEKNGNGV